MATVEEETGLPASSSGEGDERKGRSGRHSRSSVQEDLIIVREVAASGAHTATYGQTRSLFQRAADTSNENEAMKKNLTWKQLQDRYTRLQACFDKEDGLTHNQSGIGGGELSELNELLSQMREARDDLRARRNSEKDKVAKSEEEKERIGRDLVAASMTRGKRVKSDYRSDGNDSASDSDGTQRMRTKRKKMMALGFRRELATFGEQLKESDLARIELVREQLALQRERFAADRIDRERDRDERAAERETLHKLDLEKLKFMMEAFTSKRE